MKYQKPALSVQEQIELLRGRGMVIEDQARAEHYLRHISYYRLRAYWLPLEVPVGAGQHGFKHGTTFEDALALYVFDRHLRLHIMDAVERIEVSLRAAWAHHMSLTYGPHGYLDPTLYARPDHFAKALASLIEEVDRSKDTFIAHYNNKYGDPPQPPDWMAAEIMSLGQLSKWIGNLKRRADKKQIASTYRIDQLILVSIAHHLTYVRNICAHHGRLWNKQFIVTMTTPAFPEVLSLSMNDQSTRKIYNTLTAIGFLIDIIAPGSGWRHRLMDLIQENASIDLDAMGFPPDWKDLPVWAN